jgi:hypothetical protein
MISARCAACKYLRRRCHSDCIFSLYFPPNDPQRFASVHKIYGASNVAKILRVKYFSYFILLNIYTFIMNSLHYIYMLINYCSSLIKFSNSHSLSELRQRKHCISRQNVVLKILFMGVLALSLNYINNYTTEKASWLRPKLRLPSSIVIHKFSQLMKPIPATSTIYCPSNIVLLPLQILGLIRFFSRT